MIAHRTTLRPKKSLARNCATARLISTVTATTTTTQITVLANTVVSEEWFRQFLKFVVPASPRRRPVIEYLLNAALTSCTAGQTTTPAISSSAGPSHSSATQIEVPPCRVRRRRPGVDPPGDAGPTDDSDPTDDSADAVAATGIRPGSATASAESSVGSESSVGPA